MQQHQLHMNLKKETSIKLQDRAVETDEAYSEDLAKEFATIFGMYRSHDQYADRLEQFELADEQG